jgi:2,3-bisphosphoglycerate-dependent phosphoglycerate mutase
LGKLVLIRHGQSQWNLENRFTGWVDVPLSHQGREQAKEAGRQVKNILFDVAFSSPLIRALETVLLVLSANQDQRTPILLPEDRRSPAPGRRPGQNREGELPVYRTSALMERHYGELQGLEKGYCAERWGREQLQLWRRSYDQAPPGGESLKDLTERVIPYFWEMISPCLEQNRNVLVAAHGSPLRALVMIIKGLPPAEVARLEIATGRPVIFELDGFSARGFIEKGEGACLKT